ncbi:hypothetical protein K438DRAFT_1776750 [Mycena galopus ATCC 62051]|nr:hypothetical protein K438DRAFT_1776750 [Mycena galopus ATCC 62051]
MAVVVLRRGEGGMENRKAEKSCPNGRARSARGALTVCKAAERREHESTEQKKNRGRGERIWEWVKGIARASPLLPPAHQRSFIVRLRPRLRHADERHRRRLPLKLIQDLADTSQFTGSDGGSQLMRSEGGSTLPKHYAVIVCVDGELAVVSWAAIRRGDAWPVRRGRGERRERIRLGCPHAEAAAPEVDDKDCR